MKMKKTVTILAIFVVFLPSVCAVRWQPIASDMNEPVSISFRC